MMPDALKGAVLDVLVLKRKVQLKCTHQRRVVWIRGMSIRQLHSLAIFNHAGYLGTILFEQELEQPLLGQSLSITSLVDLEGAFPHQRCNLVPTLLTVCARRVTVFVRPSSCQRDPVLTGASTSKPYCMPTDTSIFLACLYCGATYQLCSYSCSRCLPARCQAPGTR